MKEGKNIKTRQSNFELMRIISMFMIVLWHCIMHSNLLSRTTGNLHLFLELIFMFTAVHVNSFILLSGYFGYNKDTNPKKILSLITQTWFYKAIYVLIFVGLGLVTMSYFDLFLFLTPLNYSYSFGTFYWFINIYIGLYFFMPYLNILIKKLSQTQHRKLLIISFIVLSLIPYFTMQQVVDNSGYHIASFIFLYLIGAYFGKYKIAENYHFRNYSNSKKQIIYIILLIFILIIDFFMICTKDLLSTNNNIFLFYLTSLLSKGEVLFSSPILIIESVIYLLVFETFDFKNKIINKLSSLMFGVYLVHENSFVYNYIYQYLPLGITGEIYGKSVVINLFLMTIGIFVVAIIIEFFRKIIFHFINKMKITKKIKLRLENWFLSI